MKSQWMGDVNDYRKYGILRILGRCVNETMLCWMMTAPNSRTDGSRTVYLDRPSEWKRFDPELFKLLRFLVKDGRRSTRFIERSGILGKTGFFAREIEDPLDLRREYFWDLRGTLDEHPETELVYFDSDNGMEIGSVPKGSAGSAKYLYWDEVSSVYRRGRSVLLYQHFPRRDHETFVRAFMRESASVIQVRKRFAFVSSDQVFLLIPQERKIPEFVEAAKQISARWSPVLQVHVRIEGGVSGSALAHPMVEAASDPA